MAIFCKLAPKANTGTLLQNIKQWQTHVVLHKEETDSFMGSIHFMVQVKDLIISTEFVVHKWVPPNPFHGFLRRTNSLFEAVTWYNNPDNDVFPQLPDGRRGDFY